MTYECKYCKGGFTTKSYLNYHQKNANYCLLQQGLNNKIFKCKYCDKVLSCEKRLKTHFNVCSEYLPSKLKEEHKKEINSYDEKIKFLEEQLKEKDAHIRELEDRLENVAISAVSRPFQDEAVIEIEDTFYESQFTIESDTESESDSDDEEKYELTPLEVDNGYTIEHRDEDGYINVTNLCKAGGKQFKAWKRLDKTKAFIHVLSSTVKIHTSDLIKLGTGSKYKNSQTWVHPQVAINIAQWISPRFDVKVSGWVYEIMMTGKVDITNTKSYKELQQENKNKELKIKYLTKKYVKAQPRIQYEEKNVVYILTTKRMKKDRVYILGKANNLTNRLSTYNKSDEHQVIYYQECGDEETMALVESSVFHNLKKYREQANRERFILPKEEKIEKFIDSIKNSIDFFNNK
jgi:hypothetical protein